ncbi:hypothetical protein [Streptomyces sp. NPDC048644]|uniref:hypothetical protein n=1 Tax=Streptomyces sp. NPDC048644 TaxID=3365582 RepID=UPI00372441C4
MSGCPDTKSGQPRVPGVRYKKVTRYRTETTTIDGQSETRQVAYPAWDPVPPRDLDDLVLRAVTGTAIGVTALSVAGTTASVGGLLGHLVPSPVAYSVALVFDAVWLACLGVEWLERLDPQRAAPARRAGWVALLVSMGAVVSYGVTLHQPVAGGAGAAVGLLAKGLWWLVLRHYAVPLSPGVAHWLSSKQEKAIARRVVAQRMRRLDREDAYLRAAFPETAGAASAITTTQAPLPLAAPDMSAPVSGQQSAPGEGGELVSPPLPPHPSAGAAVPPPPPPPSEDEADGGPEGEPASEAPLAGGGPALRPVGPPSIAGTIRAVLAEHPSITDTALIEHVRKAHGDSPKHTETVPRTRRRIERKRAS